MSPSEGIEEVLQSPQQLPVEKDVQAKWEIFPLFRLGETSQRNHDLGILLIVAFDSN